VIQPPPSWAEEILKGGVDLEDLYEKCWSIARYNSPQAFELDRVLQIRLTIEHAKSNKELKQSIDKLNRESSRIATFAVAIAIVSLATSISGCLTQRTLSPARDGDIQNYLSPESSKAGLVP
jgi:hypothetical protein